MSNTAGAENVVLMPDAKANKRLKIGLDTELPGDLPSAGNVFFGGGAAWKNLYVFQKSNIIPVLLLTCWVDRDRLYLGLLK